MLGKIQPRNNAVPETTDIKITNEILLQFNHLVFTVIGVLIIAGNITVANLISAFCCTGRDRLPIHVYAPLRRLINCCDCNSVSAVSSI